MTRQTLTARLMGDPEPDRQARSDALRATLPVRQYGASHAKKTVRAGGGR